jgi:hypothetical protein
VESPDFGLTVLALCAPSVAYYIDGKIGEPHMILALLPFPLLLAQWGMLLTVFYQSIEDCKSRNPFCVSFFCSLRVIQIRETDQQAGTILRASSSCVDSWRGICFVTAFLQFCFKESLDDDPDLNITLYLCRAVMSFLCILCVLRVLLLSRPAT